MNNLKGECPAFTFKILFNTNDVKNKPQSEGKWKMRWKRKRFAW